MRHATCQRLLAPWREGSLSPRRAMAVQAHLSRCGACREMAEIEERVAEALAMAPPPPIDSTLRAALRRRVIHETSRLNEEPKRLFPLPRLAAVGAALAVLAVVIALPVWNALQPDAPRQIAVASVVLGEVEMRPDDASAWQPLHAGDPVPEGAQIFSRAGGMAAIETEDRVKISMAPVTTVTLDSPRAVRAERGVIHAESQPGLRITTPAGTIHAEGGAGPLGFIIPSAASNAPTLVNVQAQGVSWQIPSGAAPTALASGLSAALNPQTGVAEPAALNPAAFGFMFDLERERARALLRATHPSLLPETPAE